MRGVVCVNDYFKRKNLIAFNPREKNANLKVRFQTKTKISLLSLRDMIIYYIEVATWVPNTGFQTPFSRARSISKNNAR